MSHGLQPTEIERLDNTQRLLILSHLRAIEARRRLDFIWDVRSALSGDNGAKMHIIGLANVGHADDAEALMKIVDVISRK